MEMIVCLVHKGSYCLEFCISEVYGPQQEPNDGVTTVATATPPGVKPAQPSEDSRPASDSDDMLWEEFLQGSDPASSASSGSGDEGLHSPNHTLLPPTVLSSDEDKAFSHVSALFI